eukprot:TRINITY_DN2635_c0_g1_i1.p1 TRINITY_DN2635_c0_g1~~TRINITY_DN2635_c0_g1_i1.p1  ORF type:complete len:1013 (-),score=315.21 TRINITY_DN2635_c0_g1_i1:264-3302(-)
MDSVLASIVDKSDESTPSGVCYVKTGGESGSSRRLMSVPHPQVEDLPRDLWNELQGAGFLGSTNTAAILAAAPATATAEEQKEQASAPPAAESFSIVPLDKSDETLIHEFFDVLNDFDPKTAIYDTDPITPLPPTHIQIAVLTNTNNRAKLLRSPHIRVLGDQFLLALHPRWFDQTTSPVGPDYHGLVVKKGIWVDRRGAVHVSTFEKTPRRVTYFANFLTFAVTERECNAGIPLETNVDCPLSSSAALELVTNDKLYTRLLAGNYGCRVPETCAFVFRAKRVYPPTSLKIRLYPVSHKMIDEALREVILAEVAAMLTRYRRIVIKPSGSQWACCAFVGIFGEGKEDAGDPADFVQQILDRADEGDAILVEEFVQAASVPLTPQEIRDLNKRRATLPAKFEEGQAIDCAHRVRVVVARGPFDYPVVSQMVANIAPAGIPIGGDVAMPVTTDRLLSLMPKARGVDGEGVVLTRMCEVSIRVVQALMAAERVIAASLRGAPFAQTDFCGLDFIIDADLTPVLIEVNCHDCTSAMHLLEQYNPDIQGQGTAPWVQTMIRRSQQHVARLKGGAPPPAFLPPVAPPEMVAPNMDDTPAAPLAASSLVDGVSTPDRSAAAALANRLNAAAEESAKLARTRAASAGRAVGSAGQMLSPPMPMQETEGKPLTLVQEVQQAVAEAVETSVEQAIAVLSPSGTPPSGFAPGKGAAAAATPVPRAMTPPINDIASPEMVEAVREAVEEKVEDIKTGAMAVVAATVQKHLSRLDHRSRKSSLPVLSPMMMNVGQDLEVGSGEYVAALPCPVVMPVPHYADDLRCKIDSHECDWASGPAALLLRQTFQILFHREVPTVYATANRKSLDMNRKDARSSAFRGLVRQLVQERMQSFGRCYVLDVHSFESGDEDWGEFDVIMMQPTEKWHPVTKAIEERLVKHGFKVDAWNDANEDNDIIYEAVELTGDGGAVLIEFNEALTTERLRDACRCVAMAFDEWLKLPGRQAEIAVEKEDEEAKKDETKKDD